MMTGLPQMLNLRLDQMLMAAFLPSSQLGLYVVAVAWSSAVSPLLTSIGTTLLPAVASADDHARASARMSEGVRMTALMAIVVCALVAAMAPFVIRFLYGVRFSGAIPAALILVPAAGVLGVNFSVQEGIRGFGRPYLVLRAETPRFGGYRDVPGAVAASLWYRRRGDSVAARLFDGRCCAGGECKADYGNLDHVASCTTPTGDEAQRLRIAAAARAITA